MHEQRWYLKEGLVKQIIPIEKFVDHQYVEYAVKVLGLGRSWRVPKVPLRL